MINDYFIFILSFSFANAYHRVCRQNESSKLSIKHFYAKPHENLKFDSLKGKDKQKYKRICTHKKVVESRMKPLFYHTSTQQNIDT